MLRRHGVHHLEARARHRQLLLPRKEANHPLARELGLLLDPRRWALSGGLTAEWAGAARLQAERALSRLGAAAELFRLRAPASAKKRRYQAGLGAVASSECAARDRLLLHPSFDFWLHWVKGGEAQPWTEDDWHLRFGLFQGFAAALALETGGRGTFDLLSDDEGHVHLYGSRFFLQAPKALRLRLIRLTVGARSLEFRGPEGFSLKLARDAAGLRRSPELLPGVTIEACGPLHVGGVTVHSVASLRGREMEKFAAPLREALAVFAGYDPLLRAEFADLMRVVIPLELPPSLEAGSSLSSSYTYMKGAICLSPSEDPIFQAETLIHEFCHQKINRLTALQPVFARDSGEMIYYSPWRQDPRPLRGLISGSHAFVNVAGFWARNKGDAPLTSADFPALYRIAHRLFQTRLALANARAHDDFTDFGRRFVEELSLETERLLRFAETFPAQVVASALKACETHRAQYSAGSTGLHVSCRSPLS